MLTPEQIQENHTKFINYIESSINPDRQGNLLKLYSEIVDELVLAPATAKGIYHNSFPGGYLDHTLRVVQLALEFTKLWKNSGGIVNFTKEELIFSSINHDLGKLGYPNVPNFLVQENQWRKDNLQENYTFNPDLTYMTVPDRSLFLLQLYNIPMTENEYLAIKLHDGLYEEANKSYYLVKNNNSDLKCNLVYILHQADLTASKIEKQIYKQS